MSKTMRIVKLQLRLQKPAFRKGLDIAKLRKTQAASVSMPPVESVTFREETLGGCPVDVAVPAECRDDAAIFYIHGGGFISGDPRNYRSFTSFLAKESGWPVYGVIYRLAPEHPFPAGPEDCCAAWKALSEANPHKKLYLVGESAGGTLVLVTALMARDRGLRRPDAVVSYAPAACLGESLDRSGAGRRDPIVSPGAIPALQALYCPTDPANPYASPSYASFHDFPPLRIVWDRDETLAPDGRLLAGKVREAGGYIESREWEGTFHTFEMIPTVLPEAREEVLASIEFLKKF